MSVEVYQTTAIGMDTTGLQITETATGFTVTGTMQIQGQTIGVNEVVIWPASVNANAEQAAAIHAWEYAYDIQQRRWYWWWDIQGPTADEAVPVAHGFRPGASCAIPCDLTIWALQKVAWDGKSPLLPAHGFLSDGTHHLWNQGPLRPTVLRSPQVRQPWNSGL